MKPEVLPIPLDTQPAERIVKRSALMAFTALRALAANSSRVPSLLHQATQDIKDAWRESARPNV